MQTLSRDSEGVTMLGGQRLVLSPNCIFLLLFTFETHWDVGRGSGLLLVSGLCKSKAVSCFVPFFFRDSINSRDKSCIMISGISSSPHSPFI